MVENSYIATATQNPLDSADQKLVTMVPILAWPGDRALAHTKTSHMTEEVILQVYVLISEH